MANFCRFCGSPLEEGQVCACQANQAAPEAAPAAPAAPVATAAPAAAPTAPGLGNKLVETLKNFWKAPKATAAAVAEDKQGMTIAGIFAGVNVLAVFFYLWRFIGSYLSLWADAMDADVSEVIEEMELELPIFPMLLAGLAIAVLGIVVTALVVFVIAKLNKQEADLKKLIVFESVHSLVPTALLVVGILLSFLAWWFLLVVLAVILVLWLVNICSDIYGSMDSGKNMLVQTGVIAVALLVIFGLSTVLANWSVGELSSNGDTLNENYEESNFGICHLLIDQMISYED